MSLTYSEVGCCKGVCCMAIFTDDGGGVAQLTVVVASASCACYFTDGGCEDHLDPSSMITHCMPNQSGNHKEGEGEKTKFT